MTEQLAIKAGRVSFRDIRSRYPIRGFHCHHLVPIEIVERRVFSTFFGMIRATGFDPDDFLTNGMHLPSTEQQACAFDLPLHRGGHPRYNELVAERISQLTRCGPVDALRGIYGLQQSQRQGLRYAPQKFAKRATRKPGADTDFRRLDAEVEMLWGQTSQFRDQLGWSDCNLVPKPLDRLRQRNIEFSDIR